MEDEKIEELVFDPASYDAMEKDCQAVYYLLDNNIFSFFIICLFLFVMDAFRYFFMNFSHNIYI